jgi:hypothetical protein
LNIDFGFNNERQDCKTGTVGGGLLIEERKGKRRR